MPPLSLFQTITFFSSNPTSSPAARISLMWRQSIQVKRIAPSRVWGGHLGERRLEERGELDLVHLARGHGELLVLHGPKTAHVSLDRHVVGRVGEDHVGLLTAHERLVEPSL